MGGNGQRGSGSNLLSFSKLKKERQKNSDLRNFSNFKVPWRNTIPRMAGFKVSHRMKLSLLRGSLNVAQKINNMPSAVDIQKPSNPVSIGT